MTSLIGYKDTYKIVSYQPKQLILLKSTISFEWISVKCDNGKINAKKNRKKKGEKWSSLQKATYLDIPGNPQVKGAPEPGVMRSPLPGSDAALQSRCLISRILKGLWKWALQRPVTRGRARPLGLGFRETWLPGLLGGQIPSPAQAPHLPAGPATQSHPGLNTLRARHPSHWKMMFAAETTVLYLSHRQTKATPKKKLVKDASGRKVYNFFAKRPQSPINLRLYNAQWTVHSWINEESLGI